MIVLYTLHEWTKLKVVTEDEVEDVGSSDGLVDELREKVVFNKFNHIFLMLLLSWTSSSV